MARPKGFFGNGKDGLGIANNLAVHTKQRRGRQHIGNAVQTINPVKVGSSGLQRGPQFFAASPECIDMRVGFVHLGCQQAGLPVENGNIDKTPLPFRQAPGGFAEVAVQFGLNGLGCRPIGLMRQVTDALVEEPGTGYHAFEDVVDHLRSLPVPGQSPENQGDDNADHGHPKGQMTMKCC